MRGVRRRRRVRDGVVIHREFFRSFEEAQKLSDFCRHVTRRNVSRFSDAFTLEYTTFFQYSDVQTLRLLTPYCRTTVDSQVVYDENARVYAPFTLSPSSGACLAQSPVVVYHSLHAVCPGNPYVLLLRFVPEIFPRYLVHQNDVTYKVTRSLFTVNQPIPPLALLRTPAELSAARSETLSATRSETLSAARSETLSVTVHPDLPEGLEIDEKGTISGVPAEVRPVTEYTVTLNDEEVKIELGVRRASAGEA